MRKAFTLTELLVTMAIIAVLIALSIPAIGAAFEVARQAQCRSNLRQLGLAAINYHSLWKRFPPGINLPFRQGLEQPIEQSKSYGVYVALLPQIDQEALYNLLKLDGPNSYMKNCQGRDSPGSTPLAVLLCPSDPIKGPLEYQSLWFAQNSYGANAGSVVNPWQKLSKDGPFWHNSRISITDIPRGASNVVLFAERTHEGVDKAVIGGWAWSHINAGWNYLNATDSADAKQRWGSYHSNHVNAVLGDGSVRSFPTIGELGLLTKR